MDSVERQAEGQWVFCRQAEDQLAASKWQIIALKKKLKEAERAREQAEKARDQTEQEGYDVGVAETEKAFKAEVSGVCRNYHLQVWNEALNQAGIRLLQYLGRQRMYTTLPPSEQHSPNLPRVYQRRKLY